ncbi:MAG TPA: hypothetical protein DIW23_01120 [Anaerolineae bacterium]|nr:hypothetical protein [Anaerolineae bacterium]
MCASTLILHLFVGTRRCYVPTENVEETESSKPVVMKRGFIKRQFADRIFPSNLKDPALNEI